MDSWAEWVRSPCYAYFMSALEEMSDNEMKSFVGCDANDPASIGWKQGTVRLLRALIDGEIKEALTEEIKAREKDGNRTNA